MERLTMRSSLDSGVLIKVKKDEYQSLCFGCEKIGRCKNRCDEYKAHLKLADYEDMEEQGRLAKLPCKVGDTVYSFSLGKVLKLRVEHFTKWEDHTDARLVSDMEEYKFLEVDFNILDFGKKWFLTQEQAEKAMNGTANE